MKKPLLYAIIIIALLLFLPGSCFLSNTDGAAVKILFKGPKPEGFDRVYEEYLRRTKDTLNIKLAVTFVEHDEYGERLESELASQNASYDLVYDSPGLLLPKMAAQGKYADLRDKVCLCNYPALLEAFPDEVLMANLVNGRMNFIPLSRAWGDGIPVIHYRQDWADAWGIGYIDSFEKMERYWERAMAEEYMPLYLPGPQGFGDLLTVGKQYPDALKAGVMIFPVAGVEFVVYINNNEIAAIAPAGAGDMAFADFPPPFNRDFAVDRYEQFTRWRRSGFAGRGLSSDRTRFFGYGRSASIIGVLHGAEDIAKNMLERKAVIGSFVYDEGIRGFQPGSIPSTFIAYNGLCVPENSNNKENAIRFLEWLFSSKENHDLFELGMEGVDYSINPDGTYSVLGDYPLEWQGSSLTWNPSYVTFHESIKNKERRYREFELLESSYFQMPVTGFNFEINNEDIENCVIRINMITDRKLFPLTHGLLDDGGREYNSAAEMMKAILDECYENGLQQLQDELARQITVNLGLAK